MKPNHQFTLICCLIAFGCNNTPKNEDALLSNEAIDSAAQVTSEVQTTENEVISDSLVSMADIEENTVEEVDTVVLDNIDTLQFFASIPQPLRGLGIMPDQIPTVKEIGIDAYPNAQIIKVGNIFTYNGNNYNTLELISADTPEQVKAFYLEQKENWLYVENSGVHTFKKEGEKYFRETNNIQIQPFNYTKHPGVDSLFDYTPQSFIFIYYKIDDQVSANNLP